MKKAVLLLLLVGLFTACTGSSEAPLPALLAIGTETQVRFYDASTAQPGSPDSLREVGRWQLTEPVQDLYYRRDLSTGGQQLWVLTNTAVSRYVADALTITDVTVPAVEVLTLGASCPKGYLRPGSLKMLAVCPVVNTSGELVPGELPRAWTMDFSATQDQNPATEVNLIGFQGQIPNGIRLALATNPANGQRDQLLYLTSRFIGFGSSTTGGVALSNTTLTPTDLISVTDLNNITRAQAILQASTTGTNLLTWGFSTVVPTISQNADINARGFARGAPPLFAFGTGLGRFENSFQLPSANVLSRSLVYESAVAGIDQFVYLVERENSRLWVVDAATAPANLVSAGIQANSLLAQTDTFGRKFSSVVFIPVED
jgi:hypothetical protein